MGPRWSGRGLRASGRRDKAERRGGVERGRGHGKEAGGRPLPERERASKMATTKRVLYVGEQVRALARVWVNPVSVRLDAEGGEQLSQRDLWLC